jgi:RHS repeat-associated protein
LQVANYIKSSLSKSTPPSGEPEGAYHTDHPRLREEGNIRLRYAINPVNQWLEILEEDHYYPFGLKHQGYNAENYVFATLGGGPVQLIPTNPNVLETYKYKFNSREYDSSFGLNVTEMDFRQYDNTLGRFNIMDEMAELAYEVTPFRFGFNNPNFFSDPTGLWEEIEGGYRTTDEDEIARFIGYLKYNEGADKNIEGMMNFIKEDIAFFESFDSGVSLSTAYVKNGKITDYSVHRMKNEIAYYQGYTDYIYTREDYEMRNKILSTKGPITTELLNRETEGWYQPITAKNWISYIGDERSARMLVFSEFAGMIDGPSVSTKGSRMKTSGSLGKTSKYSASSRVAKMLGFQSAADVPNSVRNMSFNEFHKNFSSHYIGKFKGRGTYMNYMARDWKALKAGL